MEAGSSRLHFYLYVGGFHGTSFSSLWWNVPGDFIFIYIDESSMRLHFYLYGSGFLGTSFSSIWWNVPGDFIFIYIDESSMRLHFYLYGGGFLKTWEMKNGPSSEKFESYWFWRCLLGSFSRKWTNGSEDAKHFSFNSGLFWLPWTK